MRLIVTDQLAWSVCRSVTVVIPAKMAEPIEMPFGLWSRMGPMKHVLHGGAHWCTLVNAIEPFMFAWTE